MEQFLKSKKKLNKDDLTGLMCEELTDNMKVAMQSFLLQR
jgi:hypothetical protein